MPENIPETIPASDTKERKKPISRAARIVQAAIITALSSPDTIQIDTPKLINETINHLVPIVATASTRGKGLLAQTENLLTFSPYSPSWESVPLAHTENPGYRPILQQIKEAITGYEQSSGHVIYSLPPKQETRLYLQALSDYLRYRQDKPTKFSDFLLNFYGQKLGSEAQTAFHTNETNFQNYFDCLVVGCGIRRHVLESSKLNPDEPENRQLIEEHTKARILVAKQFVEEQVAKNNLLPVSASKILTYFLNQNQGNLNESIWDTATFLEFMARNDLETGIHNTSANLSPNERAYVKNQACQWFVDNILDEYGQSLNYQQLADGTWLSFFSDNPPQAQRFFSRFPSQENGNYSIFSKIGSPYHSWGLLTMLISLNNPELSALGSLCWLIKDYSLQGVVKTESDLRTIAEMKQIADYLQRFQPKPPLTLKQSFARSHQKEQRDQYQDKIRQAQKINQRK